MNVIAAKYFTNIVVIEFHKCIENMYLGIFRLWHINWGGLWVYILSFICLYMTKYYIKPEGYFSLHRKFKMLGETKFLFHISTFQPSSNISKLRRTVANFSFVLSFLSNDLHSWGSYVLCRFWWHQFFNRLDLFTHLNRSVTQYVEG